MSPPRGTEAQGAEAQGAARIGGIGQHVRRKEDARFIRGKGRYVDDIQLPGMLYLELVRSPFAHARIEPIDISEAMEVPGVLAVITGEDLAEAGLDWMPTLSHDRQMVLATGKVLFQGQEVAAVVAEDRGPATAVDPVCGMTVEVERARHTYEHAGTLYYFCCPRCRERFSGDPDRFAAA